MLLLEIMVNRTVTSASLKWPNEMQFTKLFYSVFFFFYSDFVDFFILCIFFIWPTVLISQRPPVCKWNDESFFVISFDFIISMALWYAIDLIETLFNEEVYSEGAHWSD